MPNNPPGSTCAPVQLPGRRNAVLAAFGRLAYQSALLRSKFRYVLDAHQRKDCRQRLAAALPREGLSPQELERLTKACFGYGAMAACDIRGEIAALPIEVEFHGVQLRNLAPEVLFCLPGDLNVALFAEILERALYEGSPADPDKAMLFTAAPPCDLRTHRRRPNHLRDKLREAAKAGRPVAAATCRRKGIASARINIAKVYEPGADETATREAIEKAFQDHVLDNPAQYDWLTDP